MSKEKKELDTKNIEIALQRLNSVYSFMSPRIQEAIDTLSETVNLLFIVMEWLALNPEKLEGSPILGMETEEVRNVSDLKN